MVRKTLGVLACAMGRGHNGPVGSGAPWPRRWVACGLHWIGCHSEGYWVERLGVRAALRFWLDKARRAWWRK